jgi:hypothetical protein
MPRSYKMKSSLLVTTVEGSIVEEMKGTSIKSLEINLTLDMARLIQQS